MRKTPFHVIQTTAKIALLLYALMAGTANMRADDTYTQVMSLDDIDTEATYILAYILSNNTVKAMGALDSDKYGTIISNASNLTASGNTITVSSKLNPKPLEFTISKSDDYYTLAFGETPTYIGNSNNYYFSTTTSAPTDNKYKWAIVYNDTYSRLLIRGHKSSDGYIQFSSSKAGVYASSSLSTNGKTTLFKKDATPITISPNCTDGNKYYSTYSSSHAFKVPEGLTVSEISVSNGKLNVADYATGAVVPANTGVMIAATSAGQKTLVLSESEGTSVLGSDNCLRPSGDAGITAAAMASADGSCKFYRLTMHNGEQIGYWWGAENGGSFSVAANKAYLAVPISEPTRSGFSLFDEETAIDQLLSGSKTEKETQDCYDLQGRRITNNKLQKGLYIVNGRKVIR